MQGGVNAFFDAKGIPFLYLLLTVGTPFTYLAYNIASPLTPVNAMFLKYGYKPERFLPIFGGAFAWRGLFSELYAISI